MTLIDTHAHLTYPELSRQLDAVLDRSAQAGVERIITVGTRLTDAREAIALTERYPERISAAIGVHPHEADRVSDADVVEMTRLWEEHGVVALGEIGLDHHYDVADRTRQREVFSAQLRAAASHDKPIVIHCREAIDEAVSLLTDHGFTGRRVVFHCFTGTAEEARRLADHGWRLSFTGIVTFRNSQPLQDIARNYPGDELMVETDAPYLSPVPVRGRQPNEPSFVAHTARFLAELRGTSFEELARQTTRNAITFFGLPDRASTTSLTR